MTITEKVEAIDKLCEATVCYSCNFVCVCSRIGSLYELTEDNLDKIIENGNKLGAGPLFLTRDGRVVTSKCPRNPLEVPDEDRFQNNKSSDEKGARDDTNETV